MIKSQLIFNFFLLLVCIFQIFAKQWREKGIKIENDKIIFLQFLLFLAWNRDFDIVLWFFKTTLQSTFLLF